MPQFALSLISKAKPMRETAAWKTLISVRLFTNNAVWIILFMVNNYVSQSHLLTNNQQKKIYFVK